MIELACCNIEKLDLKKGYELVSQKRREKIDFYRFDKDKKLSCGAYLLANKMLEKNNIIKPQFKVDKYGKTYISNYDNIYFNISHSGKMVLCAISDREIGCDVEYNDAEIDLNIARNYFFNTEYKNIIKSENPSDEFFKYWVLKESYMKYTGLGFRLELNSFEIIIDNEIKLKNDEKDIKFSLFNIGEYKIASAGHYRAKKVKKFCVDEIY